MTTIPNLNVVVQQGSVARDTQNVRQQSQDPGQIVPANQPEKDSEQMTTVQDTSTSDGIKTDEEKTAKEEGQQHKKKKKKEDEEEEVKDLETDPDAPGQLLNVKI